jgi:hypothetical protein
VLRGERYPFNLVIEAQTYLILDKDRRIVQASYNFPGTRKGLTNMCGMELKDAFDTHEFLFWCGLVELACVSKACVELRASEKYQVYKIIIKAIWNDNDIMGCIITRFPYNTQKQYISTNNLLTLNDEQHLRLEDDETRDDGKNELSHIVSHSNP